MIAQQSTYNVISDTNEWLNSSARREKIKMAKTLHGDSDTTPLHWNKIAREYENAQSSQ